MPGFLGLYRKPDHPITLEQAYVRHYLLNHLQILRYLPRVVDLYASKELNSVFYLKLGQKTLSHSDWLEIGQSLYRNGETYLKARDLHEAIEHKIIETNIEELVRDYPQIGFHNIKLAEIRQDIQNYYRETLCREINLPGNLADDISSYL